MDYADTNFKGVPGPGRPKGSQNKISAERKARMEQLVNMADELVEEAMRKLKPKELMDIWIGINEFLTPKLQRVSIDTGEETDKEVKYTFEVVPSGTPPAEEKSDDK